MRERVDGGGHDDKRDDRAEQQRQGTDQNRRAVGRDVAGVVAEVPLFGGTGGVGVRHRAGRQVVRHESAGGGDVASAGYAHYPLGGFEQTAAVQTLQCPQAVGGG